jgi:Skp family chaperone for outer membrane proteins
MVAVGLMAFGIGNTGFCETVINQKVAVVDVNAVVAKSAQVKALKKEEEKKEKEIVEWLKKAKADVEKQQTQEGKEKLLEKYKAELEKKKLANAKDYQTKLKAIDKNISETIAAQAKLIGYDIVLSKGIVLYGGDDITAVIQKAVK